MGQQSVGNLKTKNRDFNNVLDSYANYVDGYTQPLVPNYSNKIEVDAATLTIAYATHMGRPVIQLQACVFTLPAVADVQGDIWIINGKYKAKYKYRWWCRWSIRDSRKNIKQLNAILLFKQHF